MISKIPFSKLFEDFLAEWQNVQKFFVFLLSKLGKIMYFLSIFQTRKPDKPEPQNPSKKFHRNQKPDEPEPAS